MARPAYAYAAGAVVSEFDDMMKELQRQIYAAFAMPPDMFRSLSKVYNGARVKIIDKNTGEVLFEGDGSFTINLPKAEPGKSFVIGLPSSQTISGETGDVSAESRWRRACNHDIKVYDSGFTKERYCTKCTWKEKL